MSLSILIINAFPPSRAGRGRFTAFRAAVKRCFAALPLVHAPIYVERSLLTLRDLVVDASNSEFPDLSPARRFDSLDFIFVDGDDTLVPWHPLAATLAQLLRLAVASDKFVFAAGAAGLLVGCVCSVGLNRALPLPLTYAARMEEFGEIEDGDRIVFDHLLAKDTGALYQFHPTPQPGPHGSWRRIAELGVRSIKLSKTEFRPHVVDAQTVGQGVGRVAGRVCPKFLRHYLFAGFPARDFTVARSASDWTTDSRKKGAEQRGYDVLCDAADADVVLGAREVIALLCHVTKRDAASLRMLENYVHHNYKRITVEGRVSKIVSQDMSVLAQLACKAPPPPPAHIHRQQQQQQQQQQQGTGSRGGEESLFVNATHLPDGNQYNDWEEEHVVDPFASQRHMEVETPGRFPGHRPAPRNREEREAWQLPPLLLHFSALCEGDILSLQRLYSVRADFTLTAARTTQLSQYRSQRLSQSMLPKHTASRAVTSMSTLKSRSSSLLGHAKRRALEADERAAGRLASSPMLQTLRARHSERRLKATWSQTSVPRGKPSLHGDRWASVDTSRQDMEAKYPWLEASQAQREICNGVEGEEGEGEGEGKRKLNRKVYPHHQRSLPEMLTRLVAKHKDRHTVHERKCDTRKMLHPQWDFAGGRARRSRPSSSASSMAPPAVRAVTPTSHAVAAADLSFPSPRSPVDVEGKEDVPVSPSSISQRNSARVPTLALNTRTRADPRKKLDQYRRSSVMSALKHGFASPQSRARRHRTVVHAPVLGKPLVPHLSATLCNVQPRFLDWHKDNKEKKISKKKIRRRPI